MQNLFAENSSIKESSMTVQPTHMDVGDYAVAVKVPPAIPHSTLSTVSTVLCKL